MRTMARVTTVLLLASLALSTGCKRRPKDTIYGAAGGADYVPPGEMIDESGMPLVPGVPFDQSHQRVADINFAPVYFAYDSYQLAPEEVVKIEQVAEFMRNNKDVVLIVEGHCDERGSNEYNLSLGEQRALAIRSYLLNLGIAPERIQTRSFGEERPAVPGHDESAWRFNRRGEFALYR